MEDEYVALLGHQIGDYIIDELIGVGGQAIVFLAHGREFGNRKSALKVFGLTDYDPNSVNTGLNEARKQSAIGHSSVVTFYMPGVEMIEFNGKARQILYIPMEFADRGSCVLNPPFTNRHLSVLDLRTMIGLLDGLQAIHKMGIIHADIKPGNILQFSGNIDGEDRIILKITDFGISKVLSAFGAGSSVPSAVTPEFMYPEQLKHEHTEQGDIYSMGATLFYLITGKMPFEVELDSASDPMSLMLAWQSAHMTKPRPDAMQYSKFCPPRLALLIVRMMSIDAKERPSLDECKFELRKIIDTRDLKALKRLHLPAALKTELDKGEFPIRYVPKEFNKIFKPKIHELCDTKLFIVRIKMGHPVYSQYNSIIDYLIRRLSDCFSLYETWGTYDLCIFLWSKSDDMKNLKRELEMRSAGCRVQIRTAAKVHDLHCDNWSHPKAASAVHALAVQENITLPNLKFDEYLCKEYPDDIPEYSVRGFTYVEPAEPTEKYVRNAIIRNVQQKMTELMLPDETFPDGQHFSRMTLIELAGKDDIELAENDATVLIISFVARQYKYLSEIPTSVMNIVGENAVKTSTFLETRRVVVQSDKILFEGLSEESTS